MTINNPEHLNGPYSYVEEKACFVVRCHHPITGADLDVFSFLIPEQDLLEITRKMMADIVKLSNDAFRLGREAANPLGFLQIPLPETDPSKLN